jgi:hypothetical protein
MAENDENLEQPEEDPFGLSRRQVYILVAVLLALSNVPLACMIWLWPGPDDLTSAQSPPLLSRAVTIAPEQRILLVVAFSGLLGGSIQLLLRIREEFSSMRVSRRYIAWYFLTPPTGAVLAVAFYLVVRGGFFASGTSAEDVNVFAFAGIGVLVGLFADLAIRRLEEVFKAAFPAQRASE